MSPEAASSARLLRLCAVIHADLGTLEALAADIAAASEAQASSWHPQSARWAALAIALHGYFGACESIFGRIARELDGELPAGADWHKELLRVVSVNVPRVRPAAISVASAAWLGRLLGFRHFLRHAYAVALDGAELLGHAERVLAGHAHLCTELRAFLNLLSEAVPPPTEP